MEDLKCEVDKQDFLKTLSSMSTVFFSKSIIESQSLIEEMSQTDVLKAIKNNLI